MSDWRDIQPDFVYTEADALAGGDHFYVAEGVAVSRAVARRFPEQADRERLALPIAAKYRQGIYADPPDDPEWMGEGDAWLALYRVDGVVYWVQRSETYLVVMRPEDY